MRDATHWKIAKVGARILRPIFAWRGRIVCRKFGGRSRFYDAAARRVTERIIDAFEHWEAAPARKHHAAVLRELEQLHHDVSAIVRISERSLAKKEKGPV